MLPLTVLLLVEKALNRAIDLDPHAREKQMTLSGKVLGVSIMGLSTDIFFVFNNDHIYLQRTCLGKPDLHITAPPFSLLALFQSDHPQGIFQQPNVDVEGNILLAQEFKHFFQSIQIPWEYYLSLLTGDIAAQESSRFIKNNLRRLKRFSDDFKKNLGEYCQEEIQITPHPHAVELFCDDVDTVRNEVDLLEARFARIKDLI